MTTTRMLAGTAIGLLIATAASAQTTPATPGTTPSPAAAPSTGITQGAAVTDPQGGAVGTIESIDGDFVVLATVKSKVRLPKSSFAAGAKGPMIAMTAAQIDQAAAQAAPTPAAATTAAAKANIVKGAAVADPQGGAVGTIAETDPQFATVALTTGTKVRLPVAAFGAAPDGSLLVSMTAAQLSAAASATGSTPGG